MVVRCRPLNQKEIAAGHERYSFLDLYFLKSCPSFATYNGAKSTKQSMKSFLGYNPVFNFEIYLNQPSLTHPNLLGTREKIIFGCHNHD